MYLSIFLSTSTSYAAMTMAFHIDSSYIATIIPSRALCERAVPSPGNVQCPCSVCPHCTSPECSVVAWARCAWYCWKPPAKISVAEKFHNGFHVSIWLCRFPIYIINTWFWSPYTLTVHKSYVGFIVNLLIEALKCSFLHIFRIETKNSGLWWLTLRL